MPALSDDDCTPCCTSQTPCLSEVPGAPGIQGPPGPAGADGVIGENAYTVLTAQFIQPAVDASVVVDVENGAWSSVGQHVYVSLGGDYIVTATSATQMTLENTGADGNVAPTTVVASANTVSPAGVEGPAGSLTGAAGGDLTGNYPNPTLTVTGVPAGTYTKVTVDTRGRVGAGTSLIASDIPAISASTQLTGQVPIANGGTGQATATASFDALAPTTTLGDTIYHNGTDNIRLGIGVGKGQLRVNAAGTTPEWVATRYDLLGSAGVNANVTTDSLIPIWSSKYIITQILAFDASTSLTTVVSGIYTAASKGGDQVVANTQVYTALTTASKYLELTLNSTALTDYLSGSNLYFSPVMPQGSAATLTIFVYGFNLT